MMKKVLFFLWLLIPYLAIAQKSPITIGNDGKSWNIETLSSVYCLSVAPDGSVRTDFYGNRLMAEHADAMKGFNKCWYDLPEIPVRGGNVFAMPLLEVVFPDDVRDIELEYKRFEIITIDNYPTLKIIQQDKFYPLEVASFIRVLPEYDLFEKWIKITNTGETGSIKVENLLSGSIFLPKDTYTLTHYSGFGVQELAEQTVKLTQGVKTMQVKDFKSHGSSSFIVRPEGENNKFSGKVWFGTLNCSGNWRVDFEKFFHGNVQIAGGLNFWDQEIYLDGKKTFTSPRIIFGYTESGLEGVSINLTSYLKEKILPATHRERIRPVIYNSWYATGFDINEQIQLSLVQEAKDLGIELFVIDDAWFKGRVNEWVGLGDWIVDKKRFPNGLNPIIEKVNELGMDFGLWIEPEMVSPNSDLYRNHPDWVFYFPNRQRHGGRGGQLMLNLAREDVFQYLYDCLYKLLKENNIKYIKWDMNKGLSDPGFMFAQPKERRSVRIKYVENLYRLVDTLRKDFPDVWFENCSSGGGRIDWAMMSRFDFNWISDNTDPIDRIYIHDSYLTQFPANTMVSWVTNQDIHKLNLSLEYKFDVSMAGVLGVGYDITKWNDEQKIIAKEKIKQYKNIRNTIQMGDLYRIISPYEDNRSILQYVDKDKGQVVLFVYNLAAYPDNKIKETQRTSLVRLRGLLPDVKYKIEGVEGLFTGQFLMNMGIELPVTGAYKSKVFTINRLDK